MWRARARACSSAGARVGRVACGATYVGPYPGRRSHGDSDAHAHEHSTADGYAHTDSDANSDSVAAFGLVFG